MTRSLLLAILLVMLLPLGLSAATIYLNDGSVIAGEIVSETDATVTIQTSLRPEPLTIQKSQILRIEGRAPAPSPPEPSQPPSTQDELEDEIDDVQGDTTDSPGSQGDSISLNEDRLRRLLEERQDLITPEPRAEDPQPAAPATEPTPAAGVDNPDSLDPVPQRRQRPAGPEEAIAAKLIRQNPFVVGAGVSTALDLIVINPTVVETSEPTILFEAFFEWSALTWLAIGVDAQLFLNNPGNISVSWGFAVKGWTSFRIPLQDNFVPGVTVGIGFAPVNPQSWQANGFAVPSPVYIYAQIDAARFRWESLDVTAISFGFAFRFGQPLDNEAYDKSPIALTFNFIRVGWAFGGFDVD